MNPYVLLGALVAAIGLAAGGYSYGHHQEALAFNAFKAEQAAVAEKAAADSEARARAAEQAASINLAQVAST